MNLIVDTSVAIKWYTNENLKAQANVLRERIAGGDYAVAVPRIFFTESANVLWKKTHLIKEISRMDAKGIFSRILDLPFHIIEEDDILLKALDVSLQESVCVYDALYLASALHFKAQLVTADAVLVKRLNRSSLKDYIVPLSDF